MDKIKAVLTKPLDGQPEGTEREFDKVDFDRLEGQNAVRKASALVVKAAPPVLNKMGTVLLNKGAVSQVDSKSGSAGDISRAPKPKA